MGMTVGLPIRVMAAKPGQRETLSQDSILLSFMMLLSAQDSLCIWVVRKIMAPGPPIIMLIVGVDGEICLEADGFDVVWKGADSLMGSIQSQ